MPDIANTTWVCPDAEARAIGMPPVIGAPVLAYPEELASFGVHPEVTNVLPLNVHLNPPGMVTTMSWEDRVDRPKYVKAQRGGR